MISTSKLADYRMLKFRPNLFKSHLKTHLVYLLVVYMNYSLAAQRSIQLQHKQFSETLTINAVTGCVWPWVDLWRGRRRLWRHRVCSPRAPVTSCLPRPVAATCCYDNSNYYVNSAITAFPPVSVCHELISRCRIELLLGRDVSFNQSYIALLRNPGIFNNKATSVCGTLSQTVYI